MSLVDFVKRPQVRDAFDHYAAKLKTSPSFAGLPIRVSGSGGWPPGLTGTAFDYLARIRIERDFRSSNVTIHRQPWLSEVARQRLDLRYGEIGYLGVASSDAWSRRLDEAHEAAQAYAAGAGCARCLSFLVQYMAHADLLFRKRDVFDSTFDTCGSTARELSDMLCQFEPQRIFEPREVILLNPVFPAAARIGGGDGDLLIDDLLVDIKAVDHISLSKTYLR